MKIKKPRIKFHTKSVIAGAFVLLICVAAYTDHRIGDAREVSAGDYLYTASENSDRTKILGEAAFVDSLQSTEATPYDAEQTASYDTYFSAMQVDRQRSRDEAMEMLQIVVDSAESMPDVKQQAYAEMMNIANDITVESNIQSMVMAKGFEDCLALISGDNINVIVKTDGLLTNEVAQITEIVVNESGFSADKIKIIEKSH